MIFIYAIGLCLGAGALACIVSSSAARALATMLLCHAEALESGRRARKAAWKKWSRGLIPDLVTTEAERWRA